MRRCQDRLLLSAGILILVVLTGCGGEGDALGEPQTKSGAPAAETHAVVEAVEEAPRVKFSTTAGDIVIELYPDKAPLTVDNFLRYVNAGHYDGAIFHDVQEGFVVLGGGFSRELSEKATGYPIRNEAENGESNLRGKISMARAGDVIDSSTSQFFFNLDDNPELDHQGPTADEYGYCVFGEVKQGLDVIDAIGAAEVADRDGFANLPVQTVMIKSATMLR